MFAFKELLTIFVLIIYIKQFIIMKTCCRCKVEKTLEMFVKNKSSKDGHKGYCLDCHRERTQKWRDENQKKNQDAQRIYYWKTKAKEYEESLRQIQAELVHKRQSNLFGIEGLSEIEDGLNNL
jgi:Zn ribbon nucleic-acid-binding protein